MAIPLLVALLLPAVVVGKDYFKGAVFEHRHPNSNRTDTDLSENAAAALAQYEKAAEVAAQHGVDIIVFGEYAITGYPFTRAEYIKFAENIPDPRRHKINPCTDETLSKPVLHQLSCLARKHKFYLVANMMDVQPCENSCKADAIEGCDTKCPEDGVNLYNTNVAFDREGNVIARYHKVHPYFEVVNVPDGPEFVTFDTEFGKFGLLICFDLVFRESIQLVDEHGIDTLVFPTFWFDDVAPFTAVELQQSWALANGVNFMSANSQQAYTGTMGSGIYSKEEGALVYTYTPSDTSKLLIANLKIRGSSTGIPKQNAMFAITEDSAVPVVETGHEFTEQCYDKLLGPASKVGDHRCYKSQTENYTLTKLEQPEGQVEACQKDFCCKLSYTTESMQEDFYLGAFNGFNHVYGHHYWSEEVCLVVRCDPFEDKTCALLPSTSKTIFKTAELSAQFTSEKVFSTISHTHFRLAPKQSWNTETDGHVTSLYYEPDNKDGMKPLLKMALYGRKYSLDPVFVPFYIDFSLKFTKRLRKSKL